MILLFAHKLFMGSPTQNIFLSLGCALLVQAAAAAIPDAGFFCDDFLLTLSPGHRVEAAGPFFYSQTGEHGILRAVPPFWSHAADAAADWEETDFLYPFVTWDRFGSESRFQILQLFSFAGGESGEESSARRLTIFPFYFQQRSPNTNLNYTALFPFYGHLAGRPLNMRDDIRFVMFPLFSETRKRGVVTDNYLFPFFHVRHGAGVSGWQFWPLVGHEQKTPTAKTNLFDEVETVGGHNKWFALWPVFFNNHTGLGTTNAASELALLPAFDQFRSPARDSSSVLWPFFNVIDDREKQYREWELPYPFIVFARGEGKTTDRVWPFFGRSHNATLESDFLLWPVFFHRHFLSAPLERDRTRIFFFLYSDVKQKNTETGASSRRVDLLPLFTHHRDLDGNERLQILSPIEPFLPDNKSVERNWSPLWSLWRAEQNAATGTASESFLWNLYRHDARADAEKYSLLFGLFRYQSGVDGARWRWFYLPFGKTAQARPKSAPQFQEVPPPNVSRREIEHPAYDAIPTTK